MRAWAFGVCAAAGMAAATASAPAAEFQIEFWGDERFKELGTFAASINDYGHRFIGTFEIADSALKPNNFISFQDPAFRRFQATFRFDGEKFAGNSLTFTLADDTFPPLSRRGRSPVQGILLDGAGFPLRFDTPSTSTSNKATIDDTAPNPIGDRATPQLILADRDNPGRIVLQNGKITKGPTGREKGSFRTINGTWGVAIARGGRGKGGGIYFIRRAP